MMSIFRNIGRGASGLVLMIMVCLLSISCNAQKKLAREVATAFKPPDVLLLFPDFIFKKNLDQEEIRDFNSLTKDQQDSALFYNSRFLQYVNDSIFLSVYYQSLAEEFQKYGFKVFPESSLDSFLMIKGNAYVFTLVQAEMEESIDPQTVSDVFDDTLIYYKKFNLKVLGLNSWFELRELNAADTVQPVLFSSFFVADQLKGRFWKHPLMQEVDYKYKLLEIRLEDVFGLADFSGKKNAGYLFDYLFNAKIRTYQPIQSKEPFYWHFDRLKKNVRPAGNDRFSTIDAP